MVIPPELPQVLFDWFTMFICLLAGGIWGWVMFGCWRDALKDLAKRKQEAQQQLNERFYKNDGRN